MTSTFRRLASIVSIVAIGASCTTERDDSKDTTTVDSTSADSTETTSGELTASAPGVTADTITVGFSYVDLETLAESGIIKISHGPYEDVVNALVDDINANGGINGRRLEVVFAKYSPIGNEEQLAACTKLTEDEAVFAVLGGLLGTNNQCLVQQHETILISGAQAGLNDAGLAAAKAPWVSWGARDERAIAGLVQAMNAEGRFDGKTVGLYVDTPDSENLIDIATSELEAVGVEVADVAILDVPAGDTQAATAQDKVFAERFRDQGVDLVVDVGLFIPAADFHAADYHPEIWSTNQGNVAAAAFTNPFDQFPTIGAVGGAPAFETAEFARCREVYEAATGIEILTPTEEDLAGASTGSVAMSIACTAFQIFVEAATAAGPNLTNESFAEAVSGIGDIELANGPGSSFGPDKPDAQDTFQLVTFDPEWVEGSGEEQFVAIGDPISVDG